MEAGRVQRSRSAPKHLQNFEVDALKPAVAAMAAAAAAAASAARQQHGQDESEAMTTTAAALKRKLSDSDSRAPVNTAANPMPAPALTKPPRKKAKAGTAVCEHGRQDRFRCLACYDLGRPYVTTICIHRRQRHQCRDCGASSYCEHKRPRSRCVTCYDLGRPEVTGICHHRAYKTNCRRCKEERDKIDAKETMIKNWVHESAGRQESVLKLLSAAKMLSYLKGQADIEEAQGCDATVDVVAAAVDPATQSVKPVAAPAKTQAAAAIVVEEEPGQCYRAPSLNVDNKRYAGFDIPTAPLFMTLCLHGDAPDECDECAAYALEA